MSSNNNRKNSRMRRAGMIEGVDLSFGTYEKGQVVLVPLDKRELEVALVAQKYAERIRDAWGGALPPLRGFGDAPAQLNDEFVIVAHENWQRGKWTLQGGATVVPPVLGHGIFWTCRLYFYPKRYGTAIAIPTTQMQGAGVRI